MNIGITRFRHLILPALLLTHSVFGANEFSEDFDSMSLPATLEQSSCCASVSFTTGAAVFPGIGDNGRVFLRSIEDDFHASNFVFEITVTVSTGFGGAGAAFIGLGRGEPSGNFYNEPRDGPHLYLRVFADDAPWNGAVSVVDDAQDVFESAVSVAGEGTHRIRVSWNDEAGEVTFEIHQDYTEGSFVASTTIGPFNGSDNGFTAADSRIFFGGASGITFDDLSVTLPRDNNIFVDGFEDAVAEEP